MFLTATAASAASSTRLVQQMMLLVLPIVWQVSLPAQDSICGSFAPSVSARHGVVWQSTCLVCAAVWHTCHDHCRRCEHSVTCQGVSTV
jgi:hypothetical protein